jgi:hypothetical protein
MNKKLLLSFVGILLTGCATRPQVKFYSKQDPVTKEELFHYCKLDACLHARCKDMALNQSCSYEGDHSLKSEMADVFGGGSFDEIFSRVTKSKISWNKDCEPKPRNSKTLCYEGKQKHSKPKVKVLESHEMSVTRKNKLGEDETIFRQIFILE